MNTIKYTVRTVNRSFFYNHTLLFRLSIIFISLLMALAPFLGAPPVMGQSVSLSVTSGQPGSNVTVTGSGFTAGDTYQVIFEPGTSLEQVLAPTTVISGTAFSQLIVIPSASYGQHIIRVATNRGNFTFSFQLLPRVELNSSSGYVGDLLLVSGSGFNTNRTVNVYFNNGIVATTTTNSIGTLNPVAYQVPALRGQSYNVYANDGSVSSPSAVFLVRPRLNANLAQGFVGDQLKLDGTGFRDNSSITIYWDNEVFSTGAIFSNSAGSFSVTITVPSDNRGNHTIRARDSASGTEIVSFLINPKITINPVSGAGGSVIAVIGTGFRANVTVSITYDGINISGQPVFITDTSGGFSGTLTLPDVLAGVYTLRAGDGLYSATYPVTISSKVELSVSAGNVGTQVLVYGTGFSRGGRVIVSYDNQTVLDILADNSGSFSGVFNIPPSSAGQHNITARDIMSQTISASATFTLESNPPAAPVLLTPRPDSFVVLNPLFSWSAVTDPSGITYDLQVALDPDFTQPVLIRQGLARAEYQVGQSEGLQPRKNTSPYYWRVRAVDGAGNASPWANTDSFYTQDSTPPGALAPLAPQHESQADLAPVFRWSEADDPGAVTYDLQVARDAGFSQLVLFKQGLPQAQYPPAASEALQLTKKSAPYYWRVRAVDEVGNAGEWTVPVSFYTQDSTPPPTPASLIPENGSKKHRDTLFNWTDVSDPGAITYDLQVAQDSAFTRLLLVKEGLDISEYRVAEEENLPPTTGDPESPYYWRVRAVDADGNFSDWSISNAFYVRGSLLSGWTLWILISIGIVLLLVIGILIGIRFRPSGKKGGTEESD